MPVCPFHPHPLKQTDIINQSIVYNACDFISLVLLVANYYMDNIYQEQIIRQPKYIDTINQIRQKNFSKNLPFLILSEKLPDGQVYHEFPDGHIELQKLNKNDLSISFTLVKTLSATTADQLRKENFLS